VEDRIIPSSRIVEVLLVLEIMDETVRLLAFEKLCNKLSRFCFIVVDDGSWKGPLKQKLKIY